MRIFAVLSTFVCVLGHGADSIAGAPEGSCAKVVVSGEECATLSVEFDLSGCFEGGGRVPARVRCSARGGSARIEADAGGRSYRAKIDREDLGYLGVAWNTLEISESAARSRVPAKESLPAVPAAKPEPQAPEAGGLAVSGLLDLHYAFNFNRPAHPSSGSGSVPAGNALRYYDFRHNQLSLSLLELTLRKTGREVGLLVDLDFGETAEANAPGDEALKHVGQAVLSYAPAALPGFRVSVGKMLSHLGLETMKAKENWQYSRSTVAGFGLPAWHLGLQAGYDAVPGLLVANAYLYNGAGSSYDTNSGKSLGLQLRYTPTPGLTLVYNTIGGPERPGDNAGRRSIHELNALYAVTPAVSLALELMTAKEAGGGSDGGDAAWRGASVAAKWSATERYSLSPRIELYSDPDGFTLGSGAQTLQGYTLTNILDLGGGLETRVELRHDRSSGASPFAGKSGSRSDQTTVLWGFLLGF